MDTSDMWRAVHRAEAAAATMKDAAYRMEEAASRIARLLEDGYGGNGLRLLLALEGVKPE